jgi:hypothetical protein
MSHPRTFRPIDLRTLATELGLRCIFPEWAKGEPREDRLCLWQIPCKHGHISIHGLDSLAAYCDRPRIFAGLLAVPGVRVHQRGDSELTVTFAPGRLPAVAAVLKARKRRTLSPEQRAALQDRLAVIRTRRNGGGKVAADGPPR